MAAGRRFGRSVRVEGRRLVSTTLLTEAQWAVRAAAQAGEGAEIVDRETGQVIERHPPRPRAHSGSPGDQHRREGACRTVEWSIERLAIAYGLGIEEARQWGLYISSAIKEGEPPRFAEPGLFLIRPDGTLYCSSVQTMPFARPSFAEVLQAVAFITERSYPARGEA